jgi:spermidine/putrescine transport system ATP-binding protein
VALARAIIAKPRLLLLDEPLSALDRNLRQQMQIELKTLQSTLGIAFIFVTHDQEEALTMSDRIVVMRAGRIEQIGSPRDIYRRPRNRFVAEFVGETNLFALSIGRIEGAEAAGFTEAGLEFRLPAQGLNAGQRVTAALRPTDFRLADRGLEVAVANAVYLGSDLHLIVRPVAGGPEFGVIARDSADAPARGDRIHLTYDPASLHVLEST